MGTASGTSNVFTADIGLALTISGSAPAGTYFAQLRSRNACALSGTSNEVQFTVSSGAVNLSGTWRSPPDPQGRIITVQFQHSGARLTGNTVDYPGVFDLTQSGSGTNSLTFTGTFTITEPGACNPSVKSGTMTANTSTLTMTGTFAGRNTDCRDETNEFHLSRVSTDSPAFVITSSR